MQVGYKLIDDKNIVIETWGGTWGQCPSIPNPITCPNGDIVYAPEVDVDYNGVKLIPWIMDRAPIEQVSMWAVRTVLQNNNLFDKAEEAINASSDNALKNVWEYGNFASRNSNAIKTLGISLGLSDDEIDQMFMDASNLVV